MKALADISAEHHLRFVAGLIIDQGAGVNPPYSSAYLVDAAGSRLLCHKKKDDGSGNYTSCAEGHNIKKPIRYEEACVAAAICMDVKDCSALTDTVDARTYAYRVMCVPAHMSDDWFTCAKAGQMYPKETWRNRYVVLANSRHDGCPSFIMTPDGLTVCSRTGRVNKIQLFALARDTRTAVLSPS
jgi:hypothetical protein